eukprot:TRINITY_DN5544_c0_g1_i2.p1 TRINITY_DN5544_c0_g1~~TRINITY_DN5544_c0_g1_i2.p1  ORF type:complete len:110 (-),score=17.98 TRINITY_DN5544_c0_g1_i2:30-359(-)
MLTEMKVKEVLMHSALTRLPANMSTEKKEKLVEDVLELLGLSELKYAPIGDVEKRGISGGQRKRVNIGMELVADPIALFLDEPVSFERKKKKINYFLLKRNTEFYFVLD